MAKRKNKNVKWKAKNKVKKSLKAIERPAHLRFLGYIADTQGCGTIRCIYPYLLLNHMITQDLKVSTTYMSTFIPDLNFYKEWTLVQFQRSASSEHLRMFQHFKKTISPQAKVPLIYEIDDLLINIPEWNYAHEYYAQNEEYVKQIISLADGVITSTVPLANIYGQWNKNINVILNHLPKFIWGDVYAAHDMKNEKEKVRILWAGSANHFSVPHLLKKGVKGGDFSGNFMNFIRKTTKKYDWIFMGAMPSELEDIKDKITFVKWADVFNYPKVMKGLRADIGIAPLQQIEFNESKSNIKQLEFVAAGMPGVYTNIYPYKNATLKANNDEEMISHIEKLGDDINYRATVFRKDHERTRGQLFWEENNNLKKYINSYLSLFGRKL